ncbi:MAG: calcium-binding protein [Myxococcales bacterium]|nr:calcium-binding protein [Myxococcales bacterium]
MQWLKWSMVGMLASLGCDEKGDGDGGDDECELGDTMNCGLGGEHADAEDECIEHEGVAMWGCSVAEFCACDTPLVLSFDGAEPRMGESASAAFDIDVAGGCLTTDWPEASTPWLALDRDGDGAIADGRELFGSGTRLASGARAAHGFAALAELDDNTDGLIDVRDAGFGKLVLWADDDLDKRGRAGELESLAGARVLSLELGWHSDRRCDDRGNCGIERAAFTWIDAGGSLRTGEIVDLHLACQ